MKQMMSPEKQASISHTEQATSGRQTATGTESFMGSLVSSFGYILAVSYPVLALSTGTRAVYQLFFKEGVTDYLPAIMSGVAALCYLVATIGFAYRRRWSWWLSLSVLGFETLMTLIVGTWSYIDPEMFGHTVWRHFGQDYGFFPFFQPLIGLVWLLWPATMTAYGVRRNPTSGTPSAVDGGG
ncbi:MAG: hypothetical protein R3A10_07305 [Caldilineaceae bacterium]